MTVASLIASTINVILMAFIGFFIKDLLERVRSVENVTKTPKDDNNKRLTIIESLQGSIQQEIGRVILEICTLEQKLGTDIYQLRRAVEDGAVDNKKFSALIDKLMRDSKRVDSDVQLLKTNGDKGSRILQSLNTRLGSVEKRIVQGETLILKTEKKHGDE